MLFPGTSTMPTHNTRREKKRAARVISFKTSQYRRFWPWSVCFVIAQLVHYQLPVYYQIPDTSTSAQCLVTWYLVVGTSSLCSCFGSLACGTDVHKSNWCLSLCGLRPSTTTASHKAICPLQPCDCRQSDIRVVSVRVVLGWRRALQWGGTSSQRRSMPGLKWSTPIRHGGSSHCRCRWRGLRTAPRSLEEHFDEVKCPLLVLRLLRRNR
jgi:hypothetical protein